MPAAPRRVQQPVHPRGDRAGRGRKGGGRDGRAGAHRHQGLRAGRGRPVRRAAASSARISASRATSAGPRVNSGTAGKIAASRLAQRDQQVMPPGQVRALVGEHARELRRVEDGEGPGGEHDGGRPAGTQYAAGAARCRAPPRSSPAESPFTGSRRPVIRAASAWARARCPARCTPRPYRQASTIAVSAAASAAAPSGTSKIALRYTTGVHAPPVTERQTASASRDQPATAAPTRNATATPAQASTLAIAVSQTASPSRALTPCLVSRVSSTGTDHATASAYPKTSSAGAHQDRPPGSRRTTVRSTSDSSPSIWATKWLSTISVSPPPSSASRISRALYSSRLAVAAYR